MSTLYDPELYRLVHRGTAGDVGWYVDATEGCRDVLELGCGGGRILEALGSAHPDLRLMGLEIHPGLLEQARGRLGPRARLIEGDMCRFGVEERFDAILIPYSGFWCLGSGRDRDACLARVRAHLRPGGRLLLDAYAGEAWHAESGIDSEEATREFVLSVEDESGGWDVWEETRWRPAEKAFTTVYVHERRGAPDPRGSRVEGVIEHHYLFASELKQLVEASGLRVTRLDGDFWGGPSDPESNHLVLEAVARLPPP